MQKNAVCFFLWFGHRPHNHTKVAHNVTQASVTHHHHWRFVTTLNFEKAKPAKAMRMPASHCHRHCVNCALGRRPRYKAAAKPRAAVVDGVGCAHAELRGFGCTAERAYSRASGKEKPSERGK